MSEIQTDGGGLNFSAITMFSNSEMSEIDPRGGQHFSNSKKKSEISNRGGQAYLGKSPKCSRFLIMTPPLNLSLQL